MNLINKYYDWKYGKIICAALRKNHKKYVGKTHAECFLAEPKGMLRDAEQGFLTDNMVFVSRKKALKIAKHYNQIKHKHPPEDMLFSEDLL